MKNIREIITDLNVARSNSCSKEKSEEIKKIINDLLPHEKQEKALEILKNKPFVDFQMIKHYDNVIELNGYIKFMYGYMTTSILTQEEYDLLKEVLYAKGD